MNTYVYDGSFEGFLTVVFHVYEMKQEPQQIVEENAYPVNMFANRIDVTTDEQKGQRVWNGLHKKLSDEACKMLAVCLLSGNPKIELLLYNYIRKAFESRSSIEHNFGDPCVREVSRLFKKVSREVERIRMFLRFQKMADGIYFASFDPLYNVLPLAVAHFEKRFADQSWIIFDTRRKYGFYYDQHEVAEVRFEQSLIHPVTGKLDNSAFAEDEKMFARLWKQYFDNMAIKDRINPVLHKKLLPKRYWKYLTEKQPV